ncbi:ribose-phosphate diphosphokinase [Methylocella tundrae]|uniref:ribose-phosphate diphosphokinase n=1 Tax=Methylocella tundrae TaxID=227605 RepID=UPI002ADED118|nr:ribose-phosphate diphosphokinase [Methylocella tundrae]
MTEPHMGSPALIRPVAGDRLRLFALKGTEELGQAISRRLDWPLARHEERDFEDGEHKIRPLDAVCGADVYVAHSLHGGPGQSANDKLCRLLFFIGALKDAGAARVTAVVPYLCYARKDRRTKPNDPVTTRYVAALFESVGADAIVALEVHNEAAFENAFRCRAVALTAAPLLIEAIKAVVEDAPLCIISPDLGGGKRADLLREALEASTGRQVGKAFAEKRRSADVVSGDLFVGDVAGAACIIVDDLVSTGGTLVRAARAARDRGARRIIACVTHGLFMPGAEKALADPAIERIIATDTVPPFRLAAGPVRDKLVIVSAAPLLAEAIRRLHEGEPLTDLMVF